VLKTEKTTRTTAIGPDGSGLTQADPMQPLSTSAPVPLIRYNTGDATTPIQTSAPQPVASSAPPAPSQPVRPAYAPGQKVTSWRERNYIFRKGDNYASLSRMHYNNSDYAAALQEWNRDPERATSEGMRAGQPVPGDKISIPSLETLEQQYPNLIPGRRTQTGAGPGNTQQTAFVTTTALPPATPIATVPPLPYRVCGSGEPLYTIAQKTLKDGTRWQEIARLNPTLSSELPIPANTIVHLPPGAVVPAENAP